MSGNSIDYTDGLLSSFQPELEIGTLISKLLETMDFTTLSDKSEIDEERLKKILSFEGNPTLGEIKRLASVAGKKARLTFLVLSPVYYFLLLTIITELVI